MWFPHAKPWVPPLSVSILALYDPDGTQVRFSSGTLA